MYWYESRARTNLGGPDSVPAGCAVCEYSYEQIAPYNTDTYDTRHRRTLDERFKSPPPPLRVNCRFADYALGSVEGDSPIS